MKWLYTKVGDNTYFNWVKRLRQAHLAGTGSITLCGMPMLGNNYASIYQKDDWMDCDKCYIAIEEVDYETKTK